ncbi:hypothetical protein CDD83_3421 [Cordyceps sp. RAO-2017]|nr:hypothetical protein CDD83_3421 [Cordyceps sp. RAO-2017]
MDTEGWLVALIPLPSITTATANRGLSISAPKARAPRGPVSGTRAAKVPRVPPCALTVPAPVPYNPGGRRAEPGRHHHHYPPPPPLARISQYLLRPPLTGALAREEGQCQQQCAGCDPRGRQRTLDEGLLVVPTSRTSSTGKTLLPKVPGTHALPEAAVPRTLAAEAGVSRWIRNGTWLHMRVKVPDLTSDKAARSIDNHPQASSPPSLLSSPQTPLVLGAFPLYPPDISLACAPPRPPPPTSLCPPSPSLSRSLPSSSRPFPSSVSSRPRLVLLLPLDAHPTDSCGLASLSLSLSLSAAAAARPPVRRSTTSAVSDGSSPVIAFGCSSATS